MIRHLVFWKLKETANNASKQENAEKLIEMFQSLKDKIPELIEIESGLNFNDSPAAWDFALNTVFYTKEELAKVTVADALKCTDIEVDEFDFVDED